MPGLSSYQGSMRPFLQCADLNMAVVNGLIIWHLSIPVVDLWSDSPVAIVVLVYIPRLECKIDSVINLSHMTFKDFIAGDVFFFKYMLEVYSTRFIFFTVIWYNLFFNED
jgi:hypothetical protein